MTNEELQKDINFVHERILNVIYYLKADEVDSDIMRGVIVGENLAKAEKKILELYGKLKEDKQEQEHERVKFTLYDAKVEDEKEKEDDTL